MEKRPGKDSIIFVPLELPTFWPVSVKNLELSQPETVSPGKKFREGVFCSLNFGLRRGKFAGFNAIVEPRNLVRAIAERLIRGMPAAA
jgi:hypothetical protein